MKKYFPISVIMNPIIEFIMIWFIKLSIAIMGSIGILFIIFPKWIIQIFTSDAEIVEIGIIILRILGAVQFLDAFGIILSNALERKYQRARK